MSFEFRIQTSSNTTYPEHSHNLIYPTSLELLKLLLKLLKLLLTIFFFTPRLVLPTPIFCQLLYCRVYFILSYNVSYCYYLIPNNHCLIQAIHYPLTSELWSPSLVASHPLVYPAKCLKTNLLTSCFNYAIPSLPFSCLTTFHIFQ